MVAHDPSCGDNPLCDCPVCKAERGEPLSPEEQLAAKAGKKFIQSIQALKAALAGDDESTEMMHIGRAPVKEEYENDLPPFIFIAVPLSSSMAVKVKDADEGPLRKANAILLDANDVRKVIETLQEILPSLEADTAEWEAKYGVTAADHDPEF